MTYPMKTSNSDITDPITAFDFFPYNVTVKIDAQGRLYLPSPDWIANNWLPFGKASDGKNLLVFHGDMSIYGSWVRLSWNGTLIEHQILSPLYFDNTGKVFPFPTIHTDLTKPYYIAHAYDETTRTWYYRIATPPTSQFPSGQIIVDIEGQGRSIPLWMGKPGGSYIGHGMSWIEDAINCWGGYIDFCDLKKCVFLNPSNGVTYNLPIGTLSVDREYHRTCIGNRAVGSLSFTAMECRTIGAETIDLLFIKSDNPLPPEQAANYPPFEHTGRINFVTRGESYQFDTYDYSDNGWISTEIPPRPPTEYKVFSQTPDLTVDLVATPVTGDARSFYEWGIDGTKTWWDPNCHYAWGRTFVKWNGTITLRGEVIKITNALGIGEFSRFNSLDPVPPPPPPPTSTNNSLWLLFLGFMAIAATSKRRN